MSVHSNTLAWEHTTSSKRIPQLQKRASISFVLCIGWLHPLLLQVRSQCLAQQEEAVAKAVGTARGKWVEQQEEAVRAAVEAARGAWQQRLLEESKASVEQALGAWQREAELQLAKTKHQWEQEHKTEIEKVGRAVARP